MVFLLDKSIARVRDRRGKVLGAAFLVAPDALLTCWHVARQALENDRLRLDFPTLAAGRMLSARLEKRDEAADLALLRLEDPAPANSLPTRLVVEQDVSCLWGHPCRAFGFPAGYDSGVWAEGRLQAAIGDTGWLQLSDTRQSGYFVQPGFSGVPLWDEELNGVVGMIAAADPSARAAFCVPTAHLLDFCPDLRPQSLPPNPYRGLLAFREQDAALFFGREEVSADLWARLRRSPLVSVLGPSGSGKSSLVFAGLLPKVRAEADWAVTSLRPGREPFRELAYALLPLLEAEMSETDRLREVPKLSEALRRGEIPLADVLRRVLERTGRTRLLVILDQFEELFTLSEESERSAFLDLWLKALEAPKPPWRVLLTLRADFLGQALLHPPFAAALNQGEKALLAPLSREGLRAAILEPACRANVTFEDGLVERILDDVGEAAGQLPLLEFALTQLWERQESRRLTHAAYDALGGVEGALMRYAEGVYQELPEEEREDARRAFIQLVTPGEGTQDTRRRALRTELGEARWGMARRLADARLLVTGQDAAGQEYAEMAHEALIQSWATLREWMHLDRRFRLWQERMRLLRRQWQESGQDEGALLRGAPLAEAQDWLAQRPDEIEPALQDFIRLSEARAREEQERRERIRRRFLQVSVSAALLFLGVAALALLQAVEARHQRDLARARQWATTGMDLLDRMSDVRVSFVGLTLGVESMRLSPSLQANQVLRAGMDRLAVEVARMTHEGGVAAVAFSPDGRLVVSGGCDKEDDQGEWYQCIEGSARVWEAETGREVARMTHEGGVWDVAFSPDGRLVVSWGEDGTARVWEAQSGHEVAHMIHDLWVSAVAFSPDGKYVVSGSRDDTARVWEVKTGREVARVTHEGGVWDVAFSPDGKHVVSGGGDGTVRVWEAETGREVARVTHEGGVEAVAFSPDGKYVVSGGWDGTARVWEVKTGREVARCQ